MKKLAVFALTLWVAAGCAGDIKVVVQGAANASSNCLFNRYSNGKLVESFKIDGHFSESYAVPIGGGLAKTVSVACNGRIIATEHLDGKRAVIDFGDITHKRCQGQLARVHNAQGPHRCGPCRLCVGCAATDARR